MSKRRPAPGCKAAPSGQCGPAASTGLYPGATQPQAPSLDVLSQAAVILPPAAQQLQSNYSSLGRWNSAARRSHRGAACAFVTGSAAPSPRGETPPPQGSPVRSGPAAAPPPLLPRREAGQRRRDGRPPATWRGRSRPAGRRRAQAPQRSVAPWPVGGLRSAPSHGSACWPRRPRGWGGGDPAWRPRWLRAGREAVGRSVLGRPASRARLSPRLWGGPRSCSGTADGVTVSIDVSHGVIARAARRGFAVALVPIPASRGPGGAPIAGAVRPAARSAWPGGSRRSAAAVSVACPVTAISHVGFAPRKFGAAAFDGWATSRSHRKGLEGEGAAPGCARRGLGWVLGNVS